MATVTPAPQAAAAADVASKTQLSSVGAWSFAAQSPMDGSACRERCSQQQAANQLLVIWTDALVTSVAAPSVCMGLAWQRSAQTLQPASACPTDATPSSAVVLLQSSTPPTP